MVQSTRDNFRTIFWFVDTHTVTDRQTDRQTTIMVINMKATCSVLIVK